MFNPRNTIWFVASVDPELSEREEPLIRLLLPYSANKPPISATYNRTHWCLLVHTVAAVKLLYCDRTSTWIKYSVSFNMDKNFNLILNKCKEVYFNNFKSGRGPVTRKEAGFSEIRVSDTAWSNDFIQILIYCRELFFFNCREFAGHAVCNWCGTMVGRLVHQWASLTLPRIWKVPTFWGRARILFIPMTVHWSHTT
jgi:hypothetical protein